MTVIINLPPEKGAAIQARALALGLSVEDWLVQLAEQAAASTTTVRPGLVEVCGLVCSMADDLVIQRNRSTGRAVEL